MAEEEINERVFNELILGAFPQLADKFREWVDLDHLQMMEFGMFTSDAAKRDDWSTVAKCFTLADTLLKRGDSAVKNLLDVTYLEILPRAGEVHDRLRQMMTPELRQRWNETLDYLRRLRPEQDRS
jgi:hypothetical protein